jgi:hypothetical protein
MASSGMLRRVAVVRTDVSEDLSAFFIRVTKFGELGTTLGETSSRHKQPLGSFPTYYWNPKVHYLVHKSSQHVPILSHKNSIHPNPSYFCKVHLNVIQQRLGLPNGLFPSLFPTTNLYAVLFSPIRTTCLAKLFIHDLIILIILNNYTNHAVPRYAVFSTFPSRHPCSVQIFSSAPCCKHP